MKRESDLVRLAPPVPQVKRKPYKCIYLTHSTDGVLGTASKFADGAGFWLLLQCFTSWILREGVGLDRTQREPLAHGHTQWVEWRRGAKLAETIRSFWRALCSIRLIQDCMCPPDTHHGSTKSIHYWLAYLQLGSRSKEMIDHLSRTITLSGFSFSNVSFFPPFYVFGLWLNKTWKKF